MNEEQLERQKNTINYLYQIINEIYMNIGTNTVSEDKITFLESFLEKCVSLMEDGISLSYEVSGVFDRFILYANNNNYYVNDRIKNIVDRSKAIRDKVDNSAMGYDKGYSKMLTNKPNNYHPTAETELTRRDKAAFITTAFILEATVVLAFILSLIALVND